MSIPALNPSRRRPPARFLRALAALAVVSSIAFAQGRVVVNHDEWTLSDSGFASGPPGSSALFAQNVASYLIGGGTGNLLVLSANFGLTESDLAAAMAAGGHAWTHWTSGLGVPQTASGFAPYDAIFLAGPIPSAAPNVLLELAAYVQNGGSLYVAGGTGSFGGSAAEANYWNPLLSNFGLAYASSFNGVGGVISTPFAHPIFAGVPSLYFNNGNSVTLLAPSSSVATFSAASNVLFGIYESAPPLYQTNSPEATLTINMVSGTATTPPPAGGATGTVQIASSLAFPLWDVALTFSDPIVPLGGGATLLPDGQIVNLAFTSPGFFLLNGGFLGGPLPGPIDLPYAFPVGSPAFSGQLLIADPAALFGVRLSAPARVEP
jgi:hypothetical protein